MDKIISAFPDDLSQGYRKISIIASEVLLLVLHVVSPVYFCLNKIYYIFHYKTQVHPS